MNWGKGKWVLGWVGSCLRRNDEEERGNDGSCLRGFLPTQE